jgi:hypothetical protein
MQASGDGSPLMARSGYVWAINAGSLIDAFGDKPLRLVNAGNSASQGLAYPDLLAISGDTSSGYYLDYYPSDNTTAGYQFPTTLGNPTPTGGNDWNNWYITSTQLASGTALFLRNSSTGGLYLWRNLAMDLNTGTLTYTQNTISTAWKTGVALDLRAGDLNKDGTPDLWSVGTGATVTPWLVTGLSGTPAITAGTGQVLRTPNHAWLLNDSSSGNVTTPVKDVTGSTNLTATGNVAWHTGDLYSPDVLLNTDPAGSTADQNPSGSLSSSQTIIDTNNSFTISVWVKPINQSGVIASEDGAHSSRFILWGNAPDRTWRFALATSDTTGWAYDQAIASADSIQLGVWTHLQAVYDAASGTMALYVNNSLAATGKHTTKVTWPSTGNLILGNYLYNNTHQQYYAGQISSFQTWNSVLTAKQLGITTGGIAWGPNTLIDGLSTFKDIAVGDFNNDGKNDLIGIDANTNIYGLPNIAPNGGITAGPMVLLYGISGYTDFAIADLNNDNKTDIIGLTSNGNIYDTPNDGIHGTTLIFGLSPYKKIAVGDFNNDGKNDLIGIDANTNIYGLPNITAGIGTTFGTPVLLDGFSGFTDVAIADLNNDNKTDIIGLTSNGDVYDIPNDGIHGMSIVDGLSGYTKIAVADLNNDGGSELLGLASNGNVYDMPNNG